MFNLVRLITSVGALTMPFLVVGVIILATGFKPASPEKIPRLGWGRYPNVITSLEFERLINAAGPTEGKLVRPSNITVHPTTKNLIIGDRAFCFTRNTRPNDFRASGSGSIDYNIERINERCIKIAFDTVEKLTTKSLAFFFIFY